MNSSCLALSTLLPRSGLALTAYWIDEGRLQVRVVSTQDSARCPGCGTLSTRVHGYYLRHPRDLPWGGWRVSWGLWVRRFRCRSPVCPRQTFGERFPEVVDRYQRQTRRLQSVLQALALVVGGEGGARLAQRLSMEVSPETLLRRLNGLALPPLKPLRCVGVDEWAFRRGHRYGTILVDLERHRVVDLLPDRQAETLAAWLRQHPGITLISRDRASAYVDGARQGAPQAVQVADRWHLLKNLREAVERVLSRHHRALRQAAISGEETAKQKDNTGAEISPPIATPSPVPANYAQQAQHQHREQRLRLYQTILAHHHTGKSLRHIAKAVGLDRRTVRRYLRAGSFPERATRSYRPSKLDPFRPYVQQRWALGCHNAAQLFREIAAQGFTGRIGIVRQTLQAWRHPKTPHPAQDQILFHPIPSPRQASGWLLDLAQSPNDPESARRQQVFITQLCKIQPELNIVRLLANDFIRYVRQRQAGELSSWLTRAQESAVRELRSFALSLQQDEAAVSAAFQLPWSNGQTEGQVNRLKCIKRMMYGRASFGLLRARVLHSI